MLKLPLCPYCEARFLYPEVKKSLRYRTGTCPNCGKTFRVAGKKNRALFFLIVALVLVGLNFLLMGIHSMNLSFLTVVTLLGVVAAWLLVPFTVRYRPL